MGPPGDVIRGENLSRPFLGTTLTLLRDLNMVGEQGAPIKSQCQGQQPQYRPANLRHRGFEATLAGYYLRNHVQGVMAKGKPATCGAHQVDMGI